MCELTTARLVAMEVQQESLDSIALRGLQRDVLDIDLEAVRLVTPTLLHLYKYLAPHALLTLAIFAGRFLPKTARHGPLHQR